MAFEIGFIGEYPHEKRIKDLLFSWENDTDFTFSTSGSTGEPKQITFTKNQVIASIESTVNKLALKMGQEHILLCLDPNFIAGSIMFLRSCYLACPITIVSPSSNPWVSLATNHSYTFASFVPLQISDKSFDEQKFARIKNVLIGGVALNASVRNRVIGKGNNVYHTYGMTETLTHVALMDLNFSNWYELLEGYKAEESNQGTLILKTPFLANKLVTTDLVEMNANGGFRVIGRTDFIINSGAFKVNPEKVEDKISELIEEEKLNIRKFLVIGKPDQEFGERVCLVTDKELSEIDFFNLQENLKQKLHRYEIPSDKMILDSFLYTHTGKLARREIIKRLIFS